MKKQLLLAGLALSMSLFGGSAVAASLFHVGNDYAAGLNVKLYGNTYNNEGAGNIPNSILDGKKLDFTYCIDILHTIYLNGNYNAYVSDTSAGTLSVAGRPEINTTNGGKIAWLMVHEAQTTGADKALQAGLQATIWKQVYGNDFELLASTSAAIKTAYNNYLAALGSHSESVKKVFWIDPRNANGSHAQDQVGYIIPTPTPIPGAIWLFGTGVVGLVSFSRKKLIG